MFRLLIERKTVTSRLLLMLIFIIMAGDIYSQKISSYFYGQNAWMPSFYFNGEFENLCDELVNRDDKTYQFIRVGGNRYDKTVASLDNYLSLIDHIRSIGAEPLIQVAVSETPDYAKDLVYQLNIVHGKDIKFWSIGNEYDLGWLDTTVSGVYVNGPAPVAQLFTERASAMKFEDNTIKIFGPDWSFFVDEVDNAGWNAMGNWTYPFLDNNYSNIWGKDGNGNYYIDYYAFHVYQYVTPDNVDRKLQIVRDKIDAINATRDEDHQLGWAITETHITTDNNKEVDHNKAWSFYAGQHLAQIFGLGMKHSMFAVCPWSIHESEGARVQYDLGFFDAAPNFKPRSTHYHENMLSRKAKWNYLWGYTNKDKVKQVSTKDESGYAIMIMNDDAVSYDYAIRLNYDSQTEKPLNIYIDDKRAITVAQSLTIGAEETQMVFLDTDGVYTGHIVYNKANADASQPPVEYGECPNRIDDDNPTSNYGDLSQINKNDMNIRIKKSKGRIEINYPHLYDGQVIELKMFTASGKEVYMKKIDNCSSSVNISTALPSGFYLLKMSLNSEIISSSSFIKM